MKQLGDNLPDEMIYSLVQQQAEQQWAQKEAGLYAQSVTPIIVHTQRALKAKTIL